MATNLTGSFYDYTKAYGGKPNVVAPPKVKASVEESILANIANLPKLMDLGQGVNMFNQSQVMQNLASGFGAPGVYDAQIGQANANNASLLEGGIAPDVMDLLEDQAAERGVGRGFTPGAPNTTAAYLRALGLTSQGQQQLGQDNLNKRIAASPVAQPWDITKMFASPELFYRGALEGTAAQNAANLYGSMPDPAAAAKAAQDAVLAQINAGAPSRSISAPAVTAPRMNQPQTSYGNFGFNSNQGSAAPPAFLGSNIDWGSVNAMNMGEATKGWFNQQPQTSPQSTPFVTPESGIHYLSPEFTGPLFQSQDDMGNAFGSWEGYSPLPSSSSDMSSWNSSLDTIDFDALLS